MKLKHKEHLNKHLLKILYFISFLLGGSSAFILYIESDYFKTAAGSDNITPFYIAAYGAALVLVINWHHFIRIFGQKKVFLFTLFAKFLVVLFLSFSPLNFWSAGFLGIYMILAVLTWLDLDILLESCSVDKATGKIRGLYLTILNAGYLIAPMAAGVLVFRYGFQWAFRGALFFIAAVLFISFLKIGPVCRETVKKISFFDILRKISSRKNVLRAYYISFLLEFFYALMIIYTPLYLLELGFSWEQIGLMFTLMLVPFVLLQYPAGILADKYFEEKNMLIISLLIMSVATGSIYFISSKSFWIWSAVLFSTRIGASLVEILRDSYFYKRIDRQDIDIVDFFRTVRPLAGIIGPLLAAPVVFFFHIRPIFIIISLGVLTGLWAAKNLASSRIPPVVKKI